MLVTNYLVTGLNPGTLYSFTVQALNSEGLSSASSPVSILAAETPAIPAMPTTAIVGSNINVSWVAPTSNGSPITAYIITFRDSAGNYHLLLDDCNGSSPQVVSTLQCIVPLTKMYVSPFNLILGDHIYAKIVAINSYGNSLPSAPGDGAAVVMLPDAPIGLANNPALTNANQIGITWQTGFSDGGVPILGYLVWQD